MAGDDEGQEERSPTPEEYATYMARRLKPVRGASVSTQDGAVSTPTVLTDKAFADILATLPVRLRGARRQRFREAIEHAAFWYIIDCQEFERWNSALKPRKDLGPRKAWAGRDYRRGKEGKVFYSCEEEFERRIFDAFKAFTGKAPKIYIQNVGPQETPILSGNALKFFRAVLDYYSARITPEARFNGKPLGECVAGLKAAKTLSDNALVYRFRRSTDRWRRYVRKGDRNRDTQ